MLRTGRSKLKARWPSDAMGVARQKLGDLEKAPLSHTFHPPSRSEVDFVPGRASAPKTVLSVFLFLLLMTYLRGQSMQASPGAFTYWRNRQNGEKLAATSAPGTLSNKTWKPKGRPLQISSLANPPRIDRMKLLGRFSKLEASFRDEDLNEEINEVADDLRQIYGLSRWPPLISHVPSVSGLVNEAYTADIADELLCSATPCKLLLPVWTKPLPPDLQLVQIRQLTNLAKRLGRTLVLPNVGPAHEDFEGLLGLGTCHRSPIARYSDVSKILLSRFGEQDDDSPKLAVPIFSFFEWVKYRPIHPSAQIVIIESSPSNETYGESFVIEGAEVRIDEHVGRGQGSHKNCLSSKASKLAFANKSAFVVRPASARSVAQVEHGRVETEQPESGQSYSEGIVSFLTGAFRTSDEEVCSSGNGSFFDLENPDVLVVEWNPGPDVALSHDPDIAERDTDRMLDYSPRLHLLARCILSAVQRPLIIVRSGSTSSAGPDNVLRINVGPMYSRDLEGKLQGLLRELYPEEKADAEGDIRVSDLINADIDAIDIPTDGLESPAREVSTSGSVGTIWFGSDLAREYFLTPSILRGYGEGHLDSSFAVPIDLHVIANSLFEGFTLVNASTAIAQLMTVTEQMLIGPGKNEILGDKSIHAILERIIEQYADRVVLVGNEGTER